MLSVHEKYYKYCPNCKTKLARKPIEGIERFFCPNCDFVFWNNPKPVVSIVLVVGDKILMIQRKNQPLKDYWCLPGGYINYEETPEMAVKREVKEEIGRQPQIKKLVGAYRIDNDPRGINIDIIYSGTFKGRIKLSQEHKNYKFFALSQLPAKIAYKHRQAILDWSEGNN